MIESHLPKNCILFIVEMFERVDYVVFTSVDRDDLPDGGSGHFAETVKALKVCKFFFSYSSFYMCLCF